MRYRGWHDAENVLRKTAMADLPEGFRKEDRRFGIREWGKRNAEDITTLNNACLNRCVLALLLYMLVIAIRSNALLCLSCLLALSLHCRAALFKPL